MTSAPAQRSAMSPAREFARLRALQRLLRLYEVIYGPVCGITFLRRHVVEKMCRLAKLMPLALVLFATSALAQEHHHPDQTIRGATAKFYETWMRPDMPTSSCCDRRDCDVAVDVKRLGGVLWARKRNGGPMVSIPPEKIEEGRDSPDGQSHLCAVGSTALCFIAGAGG